MIESVDYCFQRLTGSNFIGPYTSSLKSCQPSVHVDKSCFISNLKKHVISYPSFLKALLKPDQISTHYVLLYRDIQTETVSFWSLLYAHGGLQLEWRGV